MSPTRRPSTVDSLRKAVAPAAPDNHRRAVVKPAAAKPVRVTLNFPPELFRQLERWMLDTADATGLVRINVQDSVRAMVRVITSGEARNAETQVLSELQR